MYRVTTSRTLGPIHYILPRKSRGDFREGLQGGQPRAAGPRASFDAAVGAQAGGRRLVARGEEVAHLHAEPLYGVEVERVIDPAATASLTQQATIPERAQVMGPESGAQREHVPDVAYAVLPVAEERDYPSSGWLGDGLEAGHDVGGESLRRRVGQLRIHAHMLTDVITTYV